MEMFQNRFHDNLNAPPSHIHRPSHYDRYYTYSSFDPYCRNTLEETVAGNRSDILAWLSPLDPDLRHQDIRDSRVVNVGEWRLLQTEEFRSWYAGSGRSESDNAVLFCSGDPGVGKTFISSFVMDWLYDQARGRKVAVAGVYFDFAARKEQSPTNMLSAVLKQVVGRLEEIPDEIEQAYKDYKSDGRGLQLADIPKMLQTAASGTPTFICVDGIDECLEGNRAKLLDSLNKVLRRSQSTRIFVTGRPQIQAEVERRLSGRVMAVRITPRRPDMISYLQYRLGKDETPDAMDRSLEVDILKQIPDDISEIFLLASLNIDAILQEPTICRRRERLNAMTNVLGLGGAYSETLSRINGQGGDKSRLGMAALMWISHAERPLKVDELCYALGVEIGSPDLNGNNVPAIETLLACCQGLVAVDNEASTARLIHFTLQEHLRAHPELFGRAHSTMAETCLSCLNFHQVKALSSSISPDLRGIPFLKYSSLYWGVHAKRDLSDSAKQLALKLFNDCSNHVSTEILLREEKPDYVDLFPDELFLFSRLHCASFFGIDEIVTSLIEVGGCDINQTDCIGSTPLVWAALNGHEGVVRILLGQDDINPNKASESGETPLGCAAKNGHEAVVEILLGRDDINPDKPNKDGRTPFWCAAGTGHEGVVKMLLARGGINPDKPDKYGAAPLWCAASGGHEEVVKILLGREDVNPDKSDNSGKTPLLCASQNGHAGVVELLTGRGDGSPDKLDNNDETLLLCAGDGCEEAAKIQPGRDAVHPDKPDTGRQNPFRRAAKRIRALIRARIRALLQRPSPATPGPA